MATTTNARDEDVLACIFSPMLAKPPAIVPDNEAEIPIDPEIARAELIGVKFAEENKLDEAIAAFTSVITQHPTHASAYNNRAQAYLLNKQEDLALSDCDAALALTHVPRSVKSKLYVQKSMILRLQGKEEESRLSMEKAAALGNSFARKEAVKMNPYAAMCNAMLASASVALGAYTNGASDATTSTPTTTTTTTTTS